MSEGSTLQPSRLHPGDVHEVRESRVRAALPNESRREVQVVVVEEDRGSGLLLELVDDCVCEAAVHLHVAAVPGLVERLIERRRAHEIPEPVLDEPQHRVRDDVVVAVEGSRIVGDEPQAERRLASRDLVEGAKVGLLRDGAILVADRAGDPRHVVVRREAVNRGDEAAAAPAGDAIARFVAAVRDRAAVGDHDQPAARHGTGWGRDETSPPCSLSSSNLHELSAARALRAEQAVEESEPVAQQPRREEVLAHVLLAA